MNQIDNICLLATEVRFAKTDDAAQIVINKLRTAIEAALTPGEPVAWRGRALGEEEWELYRSDPTGAQEVVEGLYTRLQPQRKWAGLTEVEIDLIAEKTLKAEMDTDPGEDEPYAFVTGDYAFARAIEAKLRERNQCQQ